MDLKEKTEITNKYIALYRATNESRYKDLAWEIFKPDVRKLANYYFSSFPSKVEDVFQNMSLEVSNLINKGSSFDETKGFYLISYAKKSLINKGRELVDWSKCAAVYNRKLKIKLSNFINAEISKNEKTSIDDLIENFARKEFPSLNAEKMKKKIVYLNDLYCETNAQISLDEPIDEDGNSRYETVSDGKDYFAKIESEDLKLDFFRALDEMKNKGAISVLEYQCVYACFEAFFNDTYINNAILAKRLCKTRQNFDRALKSGISKFKTYWNKTRENVD